MTFLESITMIAAVASIGATTTARAADDIEGPQYTVTDTVDGVELRRYAPYLVAEVTVEAPSRDAASSMGFRPLAGYIFGGNAGSDEIAMTAPVTTQAQGGTRIAMTAPVTTEATEDGLYTVQFSMPSKWTMDTLPKPDNPDVTLREVPAETRLAYRFVGMKTPENIDRADAAIVEYARRNDLAISASPLVAGYDGPSVPRNQRRWEVMRAVETDR